MRHYLTALDATVDHNVFKNVSESDYALMHLDDTPKKVKDMCVISNHVSARFDKEDLRRFYYSNNYAGASYKLFENNDFELQVTHSVNDLVHVGALDILIAPSKRFKHWLRNITAHSNNSNDVIKVPKNNIDNESFMIVDLSNQHNGRVRFDISQKGTQLFKQNKFSYKYCHQTDSIRNFYMPPNKEARKEYREKIDALIKKVTLLSYLKDDKNDIKMPDRLNQIALLKWREHDNEPYWAHEQAYEYIQNNYDGQLALKSYLDRKHLRHNYNLGRDVIKEMIKHYSQYRHEIEVDYFTCDVHEYWRSELKLK